MKHLPPALTARLASGVTTLAWCWRISRRDGVTLGFTDHDRDLTFDGITYEAEAGFTASEIKDSVGLAVDNLDVQSALSSARLTEIDLASGLFDEATVEIWRVDWTDPALRVLMRKGSLGEVTRAGTAFGAEVRGLAHHLNQPRGRLYQYGCDADLGDARCGIDLANPLFTATASIVSAADGRSFLVQGLAAFASDHFTRGIIRMTTGPHTGARSEVRRHAVVDGLAQLDLWQSLLAPPSPGDTLVVSAGCDKSFLTCRDRFANAARFRGFPHIPGNDAIVQVARQGDVNDGSALR